MVLLLAAVSLVMVFEVRRALDPATSRKPPPVLPEKLRSRQRVAELPKEQPAVTREGFDVRIAQGLATREIRWVIEDFMNSGLDERLEGGPPELYLARRAAQHRWLLETLVKGLGLNPSQREQASAALEARMESAEEKLRSIIEGVKSFEVDGVHYQLVNAGDLAYVVDPKVWIEAGDYLPGSLCDLAAGQAAVAREADSLPSQGAWSNSRVDYVEAGALFPLSVEQAEGMSKAADPLSQAAVLHPAQLRTLLLVRPELAAELLELAAAEE
jgi:hypothetical protein